MKIVELVAIGNIISYTVKRCWMDDYRVVYVSYTFSCLREISIYRDVYEYKQDKSKSYERYKFGGSIE